MKKGKRNKAQEAKEKMEEWKRNAILNDKRNVAPGEEKLPCNHNSQDLNINGKIYCIACGEILE